MTELKTCDEFGVIEKMQAITMYCTGCKQFLFSKEWGFTCGWGGWDAEQSINSKEKRITP